MNAVCEIPIDFQYDRKFGPWSDVCHGDRVISAFAYEQLQFKASTTVPASSPQPELRRCVREADWAQVSSILELSIGPTNTLVIQYVW